MVNYNLSVRIVLVLVDVGIYKTMVNIINTFKLYSPEENTQSHQN